MMALSFSFSFFLLGCSLSTPVLPLDILLLLLSVPGQRKPARGRGAHPDNAAREEGHY